MCEWMVRTIQKIEAKDPEVRRLKDRISAASAAVDAAAAQSPEHLAPTHLVQEMEAACWELARHVPKG